MNATTLFVLTIGLPLLANLGSVVWQLLRDHPFRVLYLPIAAPATTRLRLLALSILGLLALDHFVVHVFPPTSGAPFLLMWFAMLNGLSVYYRWRVPLVRERTPG
jgi:hypothetical protein